MLRKLTRLIFAGSGAALLACSGAVAETFTRTNDFVLGTQMDLVIVADSEAEADLVEATIVDEIERLNAILSTYDPNSEISALNTLGSATRPKMQ